MAIIGMELSSIGVLDDESNLIDCSMFIDHKTLLYFYPNINVELLDEDGFCDLACVYLNTFVDGVQSTNFVKVQEIYYEQSS